MNQAIAIFHPRGISLWLNDLLNSIDTDYPLLITNHKSYQIDALKQTFDKTDYDEIFFLNETMIVKDNSVWDIVFKDYYGVTVTFNNRFEMFLAKYLREHIYKTVFPEVSSRREDIIYGEDHWNLKYMASDPNYVIIDEMIDPNPDIDSNHEYKYGRDNLVLENRYFKKWKHNWNIAMLPA